MVDERNLHRNEVERRELSVGPAYPSFQLAKALETCRSHPDAATRERASVKAEKWEEVIEGLASGRIAYGERTPVRGLPSWVTLEVVKGGFATGELLAGGALTADEQALLDRLPIQPAQGQARLTLNIHFLSESGLAELRDRLYAGTYKIELPEEGALLTVAWLVDHGHTAKAEALLNAIAPYFSQLRFYPTFTDTPHRSSPKVHLQTVRDSRVSIEQISANSRISAQKEAVEIWLPLYDEMMALLFETLFDVTERDVTERDVTDRDAAGRDVADREATEREATDRRKQAARLRENRGRAVALAREYAQLRKRYRRSSKMRRPGKHDTEVRLFIEAWAKPPIAFSEWQINRIHHILRQYQQKRGTPQSERCQTQRQRQKDHVSAPLYSQFVPVVSQRLGRYRQGDGLDDVLPLIAPVDVTESSRFNLPVESAIPAPIQAKVERCTNDTVKALVERGLISSSEMLADVLPQITAEVEAFGIVDPLLRQLYAEVYRAFRQRRSLLLLNLQKQVQLRELPWVAAIEPFCKDTLSGRAVARQTLEEIVTLALDVFPQTVLPNTLLQELRALSNRAGLDIVLTEELAADIFMGVFSEKFVMALRQAADLLQGSFYETYYQIDYGEVVRSLNASTSKKDSFLRRKYNRRSNASVELAKLCAHRAGVSLDAWRPAANGMVIEQQQILTTQNLAALTAGLNLTDTLQERFPLMARQCFMWIAQNQQMNAEDWRSRLTAIKNAAYAWRQMIFYLSLVSEAQVDEFVQWMSNYLAQHDTFERRFRPAITSFLLAKETYFGGSTFRSPLAKGQSRHRKECDEEIPYFMGWSISQHWLMLDK